MCGIIGLLIKKPALRSELGRWMTPMLIGMTERGPVNQPTLVTNAGDFSRVFGGFLDHRVYTGNRNVLPYAVQGAFDNGAGRIYVNRIVGMAATHAVADLFGSAIDGAAATTLAERAAAGATFLRIDDGTGLAAGDRLLLSDGPRSEVVTAQSDPLAFGVALAGQLHADQADGVAVDLQDPAVEGADLTAGVTGDMAAGGGLLLDAARLALLQAGDILRIRQTAAPERTEYVTILADGAAGFAEATLLFDHPQATVEVHVVTLADEGTSTTLDGAADAGAGLVALAATAGLAAGAVVAIGAGATREFHEVRTVVSELSIAATPTTAIHAQGVALIRQVPLMRVHARDEGQWGNRLRVRARPAALCVTTIAAAAAQNDSPISVVSAVGLVAGSVIAISRAGAEIARQRVSAVNQRSGEVELAGGAAVALQVDDSVTSQEFALTVELLDAAGRVVMDEVFDTLAADPGHYRYAPRILGAFDRAANEAEDAGLSDLIRLSDLTMDNAGTDLADAADMRLAVPFAGISWRLVEGDDDLATVDERSYVGVNAADVEDRTGIHALGGVDDISIIAVPGQAGQLVQNAMITHCELMRYRVAVLDSAPNARMADVQAQRQLYDSTRGALYYPWLIIGDPFGRTSDRLNIPPSGHICGAFALTDTERGVHKAPANVVVRSILGLQATVTTGEQEILNPRGINVIRDFSSLGRAKRIWGARTVSSDTEWTYVPVRRLFLFVEKSIERGMQFAVFEPNSPALWSTIQRSLSNFLTSVWRSGALMGNTPEEAFFIDVGPTTMTQADIDAGRLIVRVGIAPVKPAEFVIFRISQKTAGAAQ
ncbi:MAG: phage tail sheath subtilisin-like domain-containing protein [Rhodobacterales bacterium]|nr:phage tail sheath subtilisin-like domain-containing protein [Rhodobacterales bacterium]